MLLVVLVVAVVCCCVWMAGVCRVVVTVQCRV